MDDNNSPPHHSSANSSGYFSYDGSLKTTPNNSPVSKKIEKEPFQAQLLKVKKVLDGLLVAEQVSNGTSKDHSNSKKISRAQCKIPPKIFKIDKERVDRAIEKKEEGKSEKNNEEIVDFMIDTCNKKMGKYSGYKRVGPQGTVNIIRKFTLRQYEKQTTGKNWDKKQLHRLKFFYRSDSEADEIFVLTIGEGESVVQDWLDTNFPFHVASLILEDKSIEDIAVTNLRDNQYSRVVQAREGVSPNDTLDFGQRYNSKVWTKFSAATKNAELKRILCQSGEMLKIQIQRKSISFLCGALNLTQCSKLCEKLSAISRNPNAPGSKEFDCFLSKESTSRNDELNKALHDVLKSASPSDLYSKLKHFSITPDNSSDPFNSTNYELYKGNKLLKIFHKSLPLKDLYSIDKKFLEHFDELYVSVQSRLGEQQVKRTFFDCLQGIFFDEVAKKDFWKVDGDWYEDTIKYHVEINNQYYRVMKTSVLPKDKCRLIHKWPLNSKRIFPFQGKMSEKKNRLKLDEYYKHCFLAERNYNDLYDDHPNIIVADSRGTRYGVEICDLLEWILNSDGQKSIYLYFVKKVFDADGYRVVFAQMLSSVRSLHNDLINKGDTDDSSAFQLYKVYEEKVQKKLASNLESEIRETLVEHKFKDFEEFRKCLLKATIVFAPLFLRGKRKLDEKCAFKTVYDYGDIERVATEINVALGEGLKSSLHSFLLNNKFIKPDGEFTPKWWNACAVPNDKGLLIDSFPTKKVSNLRPRDLIKILKRQFYQKIDAFATKEQIVQGSDELKVKGFDFEICQIEGENDVKLPLQFLLVLALLTLFACLMFSVVGYQWMHKCNFSFDSAHIMISTFLVFILTLFFLNIHGD